MERPIKVIYASTRAMWVTKVVLRGIALVMGISLIGIIASAIAQEENEAYYYYSYADNFMPLAVIGAQVIVSICWNIAEVVCLILRAGHRGIHPTACLVLDLLLWLGLLAGVLTLSLICWGGWCGWDFDEDGGANYPRRNALIALGSIVTFAHLLVFIIACWETNVRNRAIRVVLDRNGVPLKGSEPAYKVYQHSQAQLGPHGPMPPPAAFVPAPVLSVPQGGPVPAGHAVAPDVQQPVLHRGPIPSPSEVSSANPPPTHSPRA